MNNSTGQSKPPGSPPRRSWWPLPRLWAVALVAFRQGVRARLWVLLPPAVLVLVAADLSSERFDPVFESVPAALGTTVLVLAVLAVVLGVFFATYSIPAEMESKIAYSVVTKPVGRAEIVAGKILGLSLLVLAASAVVGASAYIYITIRASSVQALARQRLEEVKDRAAFPATDLAALREIADRGPRVVSRYVTAASGPSVEADLGPGRAGPPGVRWVLGNVGMRLSWPTWQTPLREWMAAGPTRVTLTLAVDRPPPAAVPAETPKDGKAPPPPAVTLYLRTPGPPTLQDALPNGSPPVREVTRPLPASGELEVPLAPAGVRPPPGVMNVPAQGPWVLELSPAEGDYAVGAAPGSLKVSGGGREFVAPQPPLVLMPEVARRSSLAGRSTFPRQVAVYRFEDVPAGALDAEAATIEAGFSLDVYAPATVTPEARATFVRSDGERQTLSFTPDGHRSTLLRLDKDFWHGGPLEVRIELLTNDDFLGVLPESVRLRTDAGPFAWNFAKAILQVWLFGTILTAAAVALSTRLSWFVSVLAMSVVVIPMAAHEFVCRVAPFVLLTTFLTFGGFLLALAYVLFLRRGLSWRQRGLEAVIIAGLAAAVTFLMRTETPPVGPGSDPLLPLQVVPLPNLAAILPSQATLSGQSISATEVAQALGLTAVCVTMAILLGAFFLRRREVAA
jgi:hypothetical protein